MNYRQFLFEAAIDTWLKKNTELSQEEKLQAQIIFKDLQSKYVEHLDPKVKNLVLLSFQTLKLLYNSIEEAITVKQNLLPTTIRWLTKQIVNGEVTSLQNVKQLYFTPLKIYQKHGNQLPKLNNISNIKELNDILDEKLQSEQRELVAESDLGEIAEMDGWTLYMPHTTPASCELGKTGGKRDTNWCTTRIEGKDFFLHYVGSGFNYILFYVIKRGVNAEKQPYAKMSIGTDGNKILFDQGDNSSTVNAHDKNLTEEKFRQVVGDKTADYFLDKIREIIGQTETEHPLRLEMERLAGNPKLFLKRLEQYGDSEEDKEAKDQLKIEILSHKKTVHPEILEMLANDDDWYIQGIIAQNPNTPPEVLEMLADKQDHYIQTKIVKNPNLPGKILDILAKDTDSDIRLNVASHPNTLPKTLEILAKDTDSDVRLNVASHPNTLPKTLATLAEKDTDMDVIKQIARHPNTPLGVLENLGKDKRRAVQLTVAENPNVQFSLKESRKPKKICLLGIIFNN